MICSQCKQLMLQIFMKSLILFIQSLFYMIYSTFRIIFYQILILRCILLFSYYFTIFLFDYSDIRANCLIIIRLNRFYSQLYILTFFYISRRDPLSLLSYLIYCSVTLIINKMGCESSHTEQPEIPRARPPIPSDADLLIAESKFEEAERIADDLFKRHEVSLAIAVYSKIIETNFLHDYEIEGVGNCQLAVGQYEGCIYEWYESSRQKGSLKGNPYDALSLCYCYLGARHESALKEGISWYEEILGDVESYQLYIGYANILSNCKKYHDAVKAYHKVIALKPTLVNAYVSLALIYQYRRNDHTKAGETAQKILSLYPENMYAQLIAAKNKKDESQLETLRKLAEKHPNYARINFEIGHFFDIKKDYKEAITYYKKSIEAVAEYFSSYFSIGNDLQCLKEQGQALKWHLRTCELDSYNEAAHLRVCDLFGSLGYSDQQIEQETKKYEKLDHYLFFYYLGVASYEKRKIEDSIKWFQKAEALNAKEACLLNYIAMGYDQKEDYANAEKYYLRCIKEHPKYPNAYYNLAILYKHMKNEEQAARWFKKAIEINPRYRYANHTAQISGQRNLKFLNPVQQRKKSQGNPLAFLSNMFNFSRPRLEPLSSAESHEIVIADKKEVNLIEEKELSDEERRIVQQIFRMFQSKASSRSQNSSFKPELLQIVNLIYHDRFELKAFEQIYDRVRLLIHEDEQYFHIIPQLFILHFQTGLLGSKRPAAEIEKEIGKIVHSLLDKQSSGNMSPMKMHQISIKLKHFTPPSDFKVNLLKNAQKLMSYDHLCAQIAKISGNAEKTLAQFIDLVEDVRKRSNGIQFVANLKIPNYQTKQLRFTFPIISKIFKEDLNGQATSSLIWQQIVNLGEKSSISQIINKIESIWGNEITKNLSQKGKPKSQPQLNLSDLIKGKVTFNSIQDLSKGLQVADNICFIRGYEIICIKNRLTNRETRDIALTIKMHETICEFSFTLKHNEDRLHLREFLEEIQGPLGSAIGSYIFMAQRISYPLLEICKDIEAEFGSREGGEAKQVAESARFIIESLEKSITPL